MALFCRKLSVLELLDKMQYSYKDLHQTSQMEYIKGHIHSTIRLALLAAEFMATLSDLHEKFAKDLQRLSASFQRKTAEELLSNSKDRAMLEKSSLLTCWQKLLQEVSDDGKGFQLVSVEMKTKSVPKLKFCAEFKKSQVTEMCSFRSKLDKLSDDASADLHKSRVELRQQSLNYEHYRDYYSASKRIDKEKAYQHCVNSHNDYIVQLTSYNKLQKEYQSKSVPQILQELESIQTETMMAVTDSIQTVAVLSQDRSRAQVDRYDNLTITCKSVSPSSDVSKYVKSLVPSSNNYHHNLHSFVPVLDHPQTPPSLLKCRVIYEAFNESDMAQRKHHLTQQIRDLESVISQKEFHLKGVADAEVRALASEHASNLCQLQLDACKKRNELNMLALKLALYKCQMSALSFSSKSSVGEMKDGTESPVKNHSDQPTGGGKSIRAMWKRFAFKATKAKASVGSLPTSDNSTQNTSEDSQAADTQYLERNDKVDSPQQDPVYALLRCAAAIRKNSSMDECSTTGSCKSRQNTASFDRNSNSASPSPTQDIDKCSAFYSTTSASNAPTLLSPVHCTITACPCKHPDVLQDYCKQHLVKFHGRKRKSVRKQ